MCAVLSERMEAAVDGWSEALRVRWMRVHDFDCQAWCEERMYFEACMLHVRRLSGVESMWTGHAAWCAV